MKARGVLGRARTGVAGRAALATNCGAAGRLSAPAGYLPPMRSSLLVVLGFMAGCGTSDGPPELGPLMPQAIAGTATAVMATPTVLPITWDGDPNRADIDAFFLQYAASPAWAMQTAEYGVGPLNVAVPRHLPGSAATTDPEVRTLLTSSLTGPTPVWGAPSQNTVYSFFVPAGSSFDDGTGAKCCDGYDGYHDDVLVGGVDVAYAIQCACAAGSSSSITPLQELTATTSHETVEAVTDPRPEHQLAFGDVDPAHEVWTYVTDGELADLCEFADTALWTAAPNMTYTIQRTWSNAAARAGTDPCIGDPTTPYYQAIPDQPDDVTILSFGQNIATKATRVAVGASGTITLQLAGTAGSGPFTVTALDVATVYFNATSPLLTFVQPKGMFKLNDTVTIQVTVKAKDTKLGGTGAEAFEIDTKPVNGGPTTYLYGLISQ
jgi:hypothetical protein